ncbi:MAG: carbohydrate-binding domain-containing protein [Prolixibacteraceae bacterium]
MKKNAQLFFALIFILFASCERDIDTISSTVEDAEKEAINDLGNVDDHYDIDDYSWDTNAILFVEMDESGFTAVGEGIGISGSTLTISKAGTYSFSGELSDGQLIVDTEDAGLVRIILNGVSIHSNSTSPVSITNTKRTMIVLADGTENVISDGPSYSSGEDGPNATIYSADDLTFYGNGSLTVNANYNDGITSKDGLIISSGKIIVNAADDGIRGKDYLVIQNGIITVNAGGDALKSDNDEDEAKGYISIADGTINLTSEGDGIAAFTDVVIDYGLITIQSGGGSNQSTSSTSSKGIKAGVFITINDGSITIDAADDAIHSDTDITILNGYFAIASGDDGIHSEYNTVISAGDIHITKSYEGLESALGSVTIIGGTFQIVASDDGINISAGGAPSGGGPGQKSATATSDCALNISGGYLVINNEGDGLDSNNAMDITGGTMIVNSAEYNENSSIDCDGICKIDGGTVIGIGVSQMAQAPGTTSGQYSVLINFKTRVAKGILIHVEDSEGNSILTCTSIKSFNSFVCSSAGFKNGSTYKLYIGGSSSGTVVDGLYSNGTYSGGTLYTSFTISSKITTKTI